MNREKLFQQELAAMRHKAHRVRIITAHTLKKLWGVERFYLSATDQRRLYIWWVWSERYQVSVPYIVEKLAGWARQKTQRRKTQKQALGMRLAPLTSKKMELVLQEMIERDFPNRENEHEWQWRQREKILGLDEPRGKARPLIHPLFADANLITYEQKIKRRAKRIDQAISAQWRKRRKWRGNPWL